MAFRYEDSFISTISTNVLAEKHSSYKINVDLGDVQEPITSAPEEVRQIIERVLQAEKNKLYMKPPRNINEDILKIIKEVIQ
ncbi:hypothetical protein [Kamptonema sp. UHCC 0994]|uniref:hypothetical protein n=1 Tax=Kamptonema sp. UHCC 0994 TaxID=3031329 RepID=UPI0023B93C00|nr:hypothetical protein [Kamptonema sp. UHCC 0994]MDF0552599.1 hypothetical protein [Kamptonema sp. UHCC 0994]